MWGSVMELSSRGQASFLGTRKDPKTMSVDICDVTKMGALSEKGKAHYGR